MLATIVFAVGIGFAIWLFLLPSGQQFKTMMADTLISTQHRHWAKYLIGQEALDKRVDSYAEQFEQYAEAPVVEVPVLEPPKPEVVKPLYEIEPIEGKGYKGYLLSISDPKKLRIGVPGKYGKGEKVSSMVQRTGALIGVNGGGFIDPEWMGNGFQPSGIVMSGGTIYYLDAAKTTPLHIVGIDRDGRMIAGKYSPNELLQMGVTEAVTFSPRFIVNGVGQIKNPADGWGIAPRTCMAQTADGTILFAIIDGRQPGHSIGATLYDVQQLFLERGAILAANLDGGSSTVLVKEGTIVNKPASEYGERYLPTAWLLFDKPEEANIRNIWEGVDISKIDPSKW
nr:phosphodiester glycosidase family protein [Paenibacillus sp. J31TS4]